MKSRTQRWLILSTLWAASLSAHADIFVSVNLAPPPLPVYQQPPIPADSYLWTPGYWAWNPDVADYYWVPGTWVRAPYVGALWTPGYWAWSDDNYRWHDGYWGRRIGYYGGINYGYGYTGIGYQGGRWDHGGFSYNRTVNNISQTRVTNVYNTTVVNNVTVNRISYNGGPRGIALQPSRQELEATRLPHSAMTQQQVQHLQAARVNPVMRVSMNHGAPPVAATPLPGVFHGANVVPALASPPGAGRGGPMAAHAAAQAPRQPEQFRAQQAPAQQMPVQQMRPQPMPAQGHPTVSYAAHPQPQALPPPGHPTRQPQEWSAHPQPPEQQHQLHQEQQHQQRQERQEHQEHQPRQEHEQHQPPQHPQQHQQQHPQQERQAER